MFILVNLHSFAYLTFFLMTYFTTQEIWSLTSYLQSHLSLTHKNVFTIKSVSRYIDHGQTMCDQWRRPYELFCYRAVMIKIHIPRWTNQENLQLYLSTNEILAVVDSKKNLNVMHTSTYILTLQIRNKHKTDRILVQDLIFLHKLMKYISKNDILGKNR